MSNPTTGLIDNYNLRFNWGTNQLEMNTGGEVWVAVPSSTPAPANPQALSVYDGLSTGPVTTHTYVACGPIVSITLQASTNKVDITAFGTVFNVVLNTANDGWGGDFTIMRDGTHNLAVPNLTNGDCLARAETEYHGDAGVLPIETPIVLSGIIDAPGDTSAHTYQMFTRVTASQIGGETQFYVGDTGTTRGIVVKEIFA